MREYGKRELGRESVHRIIVKINIKINEECKRQKQTTNEIDPWKRELIPLLDTLENRSLRERDEHGHEPWRDGAIHTHTAREWKCDGCW